MGEAGGWRKALLLYCFSYSSWLHGQKSEPFSLNVSKPIFSLVHFVVHYLTTIFMDLVVFIFQCQRGCRSLQNVHIGTASK